MEQYPQTRPRQDVFSFYFSPRSRKSNQSALSFLPENHSDGKTFKAPSGRQARTGPIRSYSERPIRVHFRPAPLGARHGQMFGRLRPSNRSTTVYKFLGLVWINGPSNTSGSMVQKMEANNRDGALEDTTFADLDLP